MSLPACQERALTGIEGALKASEPHLASMFAIFTRLNQDEPVGAEPLERGPLRPLRALPAIVLIPVMFAAIIVGALFSSSARGATTCDVGYTVGEASLHRLSCLRAITTTSAWTASATSPPAKAPPARASDGANAAAGTSTLCATTVPASHVATMNGGQEALSPPARAAAMTSGLPGMC